MGWSQKFRKWEISLDTGGKGEDCQPSPWSYGPCQGRRNRGALRGHCPLEGGHRCPYITESKVISWLIKIDLKQIYCNYSCTHKIHKGFLKFLLLILRSTLLLNMIMRKEWLLYGCAFRLNSGKQFWTCGTWKPWAFAPPWKLELRTIGVTKGGHVHLQIFQISSHFVFWGAISQTNYCC